MVGNESNKLASSHVISYEQFEASYKRYRDFLDNVLSANHKDFGQHLRIFLIFFENDIIFRPIAQQIKSHPNVNIDLWWQTAQKSTSSFVGSGDFVLPDDENERLSLLYQLCMAINTGKIQLNSIAMTLFYGRGYDEWVDKFNNHILKPMLKLLDYKIDEIEKILRKEHKRKEEINEQQYRRYINQSIYIYGNSYGNVATGNAVVVDNHIIINSDEDLINALRILKSYVEKEESNPCNITEANTLIDDLIKLTIKNGNKVESAEKVDKLIKICPWIKVNLAQISRGALGSIVAEGVIQGIRFIIFGA
ncbi:MAG TPA: hypothetical protein PK718_06435 [Candidatus Methanofastidiosa archaeon]|nr:hypothetical protein [Candidatus Methanofastidiosa archaeon]